MTRPTAWSLCVWFTLAICFVTQHAIAQALQQPPAPSQTSTALPPTQPREWWMDVALAAGFNPLQGALLVGARHRWNQPRNKNPLLDNTRSEMGFELNINPAFVALGTYVEWTPLQILQLRIQYDGYAYYGTFGAILSFSQPNDPFGDNVRVQRQGEERAGYVHRVLVRPTFQVQLGPVIVRNVTDLALYHLAGNERYWINLEHDMLTAQTDLLVLNQSELFLEPWREPQGRGVLFGVHHEVAASVMTGVRRQRLLGVVDLVVATRWKALIRPRVTTVLGYHLEDQNRQGGLMGMLALCSEFRL